MRCVVLAVILQAAVAQQIELPSQIPRLTGRLLVATAKSHDRDLQRSVILVVHSDVNGVIGLLINRPVPGTKPPTWFGGPIPLGIRTLIRARTKPEGAEHIFGNVYMLRAPRDQPQARVYAGYTGWSVPQIQGEIARGLWEILSAETKLVFDPHPETLWSKLSK